MKTRISNLLGSVLLVTAFYLTASAVARAQAPPPPPPAKDYFPDRWDEYTSEQGGFKIRFPGKPKEEFSPAGVHFLSYKGLLDYRVSYADEPELSDTPESAKQYLQEMKSASRELGKYSNERIVMEKDVMVDGHPGYFTYVESTNGWVRIQQVVVGRRVYTIVVEGRKGRPEELEGKDNFEKVAMGFINSFKPIPVSAKPNNAFNRNGKEVVFHL